MWSSHLDRIRKAGFIYEAEWGNSCDSCNFGTKSKQAAFCASMGDGCTLSIELASKSGTVVGEVLLFVEVTGTTQDKLCK